MRQNIAKTLCVSILLLLASCASTGDTSTFETLPIPDATSAVSIADLRIAPMDTLSVTVFGVEELNGSYQVDFDGLLKLPLVGGISVVGLTPRELSLELETRYGETYLQDPDVNVTMLESVDRRITVDGSVTSPGLKPITGQVTLLQSVALAGGPSEGANLSKVVVFRQINGERHAATFNLTSIREGTSEDPQIYGNDIIIVDGSEARRTYGEVLRSLPLLTLFLAF